MDPNGDNLTIGILGKLPSWISFDAGRMLFNGTPKEYGTFNITMYARDGWNATVYMTYEIIAGIRPNHPPVIKQ